MRTTDRFVVAGGHRLNTRVLGDIVPAEPTLVFLHGGLDCIPLWRGLPEALVAATGRPALLYERWGHGQSDPLILPKVAEHRLNEAGPTLAELLQAFASAPRCWWATVTVAVWRCSRRRCTRNGSRPPLRLRPSW